MPVKADLALLLVCLDSAGVRLSYQAIIWISVLTGLFWVLANQITNGHRFLKMGSNICIMVVKVDVSRDSYR